MARSASARLSSASGIRSAITGFVCARVSSAVMKRGTRPMRKPRFGVVPTVAGCTLGVAAAATGKDDQIAAAEQRSVSLGIEREAASDEVVYPRLDAAGCAEVVQRKSEQDRVGLLDLVDQLFGQCPRGGLSRCAQFRFYSAGHTRGGIEVRDGVAAQVSVGDGAVGMSSPPGVPCVGGELAADRTVALDAGVDMQQMRHLCISHR
jgi:hypothetical protein